MQYCVDIIFTKHTELEAKFGWVVFARDWFSWLCHLACIKVLLYIHSPTSLQLIKHQGSLKSVNVGIPVTHMQHISCLLHQWARPSSSPQLLDLTSFSCPWQSSLPHSTQVVFFVVTQLPAAFAFLPCHIASSFWCSRRPVWLSYMPKSLLNMSGTCRKHVLPISLRPQQFCFPIRPQLSSPVFLPTETLVLKSTQLHLGFLVWHFPQTQITVPSEAELLRTLP